MSNLINLDEYRPHGTRSMTCKCCGHDWVAVYPLPVPKDPDVFYCLQCPNCGEHVNEYGTRVYARNCEACGRFFTICPYPENGTTKNWECCLAEDCSSYDESRDVDKMIDDGIHIVRDDE